MSTSCSWPCGRQTACNKIVLQFKKRRHRGDFPREVGTLMVATSLTELDERIAEVRDNIRELTEQAAAFSGAGDEARVADRIAEQELLLAELLKKRETLLK